jgi:dethiobiotin synthetase
MRGVFVTGTGTEVGKTVVAAAICAALAARGERVAAFKPVVTGLDEPRDGRWPADHELLAAAAGAGQAATDVAPYTFGPPLSPHYAAELAGVGIDPARLRSAAHAASDGARRDDEASGQVGSATADALVCEGVGGLLVPLTAGYSVRDLAVDLALPLVVVARSGLGTINHTLLTVEAARAAGLHVAGIVMTPWADPEPIEESNRATVERLAGVPVSGLAPTTPAALADAGAALPLNAWL